MANKGRRCLLPLCLAAGMVPLFAQGATAVTAIGAIQGEGHRSPLSGQRVSIEGVVTWVGRRGYWVQDTGDGNPETSDGIWVAGRAEKNAVGRGVAVQGEVRELARRGGLSVTALVPRTGVTAGDTAPLPVPVLVDRLPDVSVAQAMDFWESLEGMRVQVDKGVAVEPLRRFGGFAMVAEGNALAGSGFFPGNGHLFLRPRPQGVDYNPERIFVDLERGHGVTALWPGDEVKGLVGVVDYVHARYQIRSRRLTITPGPRKALLSARPSPLADGEWSLATFNLHNLFDTRDQAGKADEGSTPSSGELETKLAKLVRAFDQYLGQVHLVVVQEVENESLLQHLARRLNAANGTDFGAVSRDSGDPRGIEVGFLWDRRRLRLQRAELMDGQAVKNAFGGAREPLVGEFEIAGQRLVVIGNHFTSKRGDDPLFGRRQPAQRASEARRKRQARVVRGYVERLLLRDPDAQVVVAGDLNDFPFAEPGEGEDPLAILVGGAPSMVNVVDRVTAEQRYTYIHAGNSQVLDHILVSPSLERQVAGTAVLHFNADVPYSLARDPATALGVSDHDVLMVRIRLNDEGR